MKAGWTSYEKFLTVDSHRSNVFRFSFGIKMPNARFTSITVGYGKPVILYARVAHENVMAVHLYFSEKPLTRYIIPWEACTAILWALKHLWFHFLWQMQSTLMQLPLSSVSDIKSKADIRTTKGGCIAKWLPSSTMIGKLVLITEELCLPVSFGVKQVF